MCPSKTSSNSTSGFFKLSLPTITKIMIVMSSFDKNQQLQNFLDEGKSVTKVKTVMQVFFCFI